VLSNLFFVDVVSILNVFKNDGARGSLAPFFVFEDGFGNHLFVGRMGGGGFFLWGFFFSLEGFSLGISFRGNEKNSKWMKFS